MCASLLSAPCDKSYIFAFTAPIRFAYIRCQISTGTYIRLHGYIVQPFGFILLWLLLTSHSSLLLRLMEPPVRPPHLRCGLFPSMYLPHLLVLPATFGLQRFQPPYPYFPALYVVSVRQVRGLPTASSRFHLTMDTLAVQLCASSLPTRTRDFHPLEPAHGRRTEKTAMPHEHCCFIVLLTQSGSGLPPTCP